MEATWRIVESQYRGPGNCKVSGTARFNTMPDALTLYKEAGWILLQTPITPSNEFQDMNYAVWHIFDMAVPLDPGAMAWLDAAQHEAQIGFPRRAFP